MKIDVTRALEVILAAAACFCAGNSLSIFMNTGTMIPTANVQPATIFGWGWLLFLWAQPKRIT